MKVISHPRISLHDPQGKVLASDLEIHHLSANQRYIKYINGPENVKIPFKC